MTLYMSLPRSLEWAWGPAREKAAQALGPDLLGQAWVEKAREGEEDRDPELARGLCSQSSLFLRNISVQR